MVAGQISNVPLTSLEYRQPADGLPLLPHWKSVAADIFWSGFQPLREPFEVTLQTGATEKTASCLPKVSIVCAFSRSWEVFHWAISN